jgi:hypothetical protein
MTPKETEDHLTNLWQDSAKQWTSITRAFELITLAEARTQAAVTLVTVLFALTRTHPQLREEFSRQMNMRVGMQLGNPGLQDSFLEEYRRMLLVLTPPELQDLLK